MSKEENRWIIGTGGSEADAVYLYKATGTKDEIKRLLLHLVMEEKAENDDSWDSGTESVDEVEERGDGTLYAYGCYSDYHSDYTAQPENDIPEFPLKRRAAVNIDWDVDLDEAIEKLQSLSLESQTELFGCRDWYLKATPEQRTDMAESYFNHCPAFVEELMGLPDEVEIPEELTEDEDITNWLSDTYGFCINGWDLEEYNLADKEAQP